jgi:hypothetical protein
MSSRSEATLTLDLADGNPYPLGLRIRATTCSAHHCESTGSWWVMNSTSCVLRICDTCSIQSSRMDNVSTQWGCIWIMHNSVLFMPWCGHTQTCSRVSRRLIHESEWLRIDECIMSLDAISHLSKTFYTQHPCLYNLY